METIEEYLNKHKFEHSMKVGKFLLIQNELLFLDQSGNKTDIYIPNEYLYKIIVSCLFNDKIVTIVVSRDIVLEIIP